MPQGPERCLNCGEQTLWMTHTVEGYLVVYCESQGVGCSFASVHHPNFDESIEDGAYQFEQERYKRPT